MGEGSIAQLGELAEEAGARRVLIVTDLGVVQAGILEKAQDSLESRGIEHAAFKETLPNPSSQGVSRAAQFAREAGDFNLIVGLGGGSAMDCAKGVNFLLTNGGTMRDYWGFGKAERPMLPSIGVPTTAGTGSEAQSFAVIVDSETRRKMACGDLKARFQAVALDPALAVSAPKEVAAVAGIDAVSHALESYVCARRNPLSQMFSREAWRLMEAHLERSLSDPNNLEARGGTLIGAYFAGMGIECSMLGAAHAMANPLTALYGLAHGAAVALTLPSVIRYNRPVAGALYEELERAAGRSAPLEERFIELRAAGGLPTRIRECGAPKSDIPTLAEKAMNEWTGTFNPRELTVEALQTLYEEAY